MQRLYMRSLRSQRPDMRYLGIQYLYNDDYSMDVIGHDNEFVDCCMVMMMRDFRPILKYGLA